MSQAVTRSTRAWARRDLNARQATIVAGLTMGIITCVDLVEDGRLGFVFSLGFVLLVVTIALGVDLDSLFRAGVLPAPLLICTLAVVTMFWSDAIQVNGMSDDAGFIGRLIATTLDHGKTLVVGQGLTLALIALRIVSAPGRRP